jgi:Flp pilus assembly pilin Flp
MVQHVITWLSQFDREDEGQGLVEYALIIFLVSIASILALTALGTTVSGVFTQITGSL